MERMSTCQWKNVATCKKIRAAYLTHTNSISRLIMGLALVNSLSHNNDAESQSRWATVGNEIAQRSEDEKPFPLSNVSSHSNVEFIDEKWGGGPNGIKQAKKWLEGSYDLWKQWTGYLVQDALEPHNQRKF